MKGAGSVPEWSAHWTHNLEAPDLSCAMIITKYTSWIYFLGIL